jgi:hypothetical protein
MSKPTSMRPGVAVALIDQDKSVVMDTSDRVVNVPAVIDAYLGVAHD